MHQDLKENLRLLASFSWHTSHLKLSDFLRLSGVLKKGESLYHLDQYVSDVNLKKSIRSWIRNDFEFSKRELEWCFSQGIRLTFFGCEDYPYSFTKEEEPPVAFLYKGQPCWKLMPSLSVVGSRNPSSYSLQWMDEYFVEVLKKREFLVTSGAATGIDQKAHALSLRVGLPTVSFLPSGFREIYPQSFSQWEGPILEAGGALISGFSPFQRVFKSSFHRRNQWIAAFSNLLFVVEAGRRSGSMLTARMALEKGKLICTLPFSPVMEKGQGSLDLIFDGAFLLRNEKDLISLIDRYLFSHQKQVDFETRPQ